MFQLLLSHDGNAAICSDDKVIHELFRTVTFQT
jgi:hypothetical protein